MSDTSDRLPIEDDNFAYFDEDPADEQPGVNFVSDEPMASHSYGVTAREERLGESIAERDKHTWREVDESDLGESDTPVGRIVQKGDQDVDESDDESEAVAVAYPNENDLTAEESAMHHEPPGDVS